MIVTWFRYDDQGNLILKLYIQPGAKSTGVAGLHGDALKIKLAAAPVDGKANTALLKFLAGRFDVPVHRVILRQGDKARHKVILIERPGIAAEILFNV